MSPERESKKISDSDVERLVDEIHTLDVLRETIEIDTAAYKNEKKDILKTIGSYPFAVVEDVLKKYNLAYPARKYSVNELLIQNRLSSLLKWNDIINLDIKIEYIVQGLIPKGSITLLFGRGGIGKTTIALQLAKAVAEGVPFGNLQTLKTPVYYIDFENPLPVLKERAVNIGQADNLLVWHLSNNSTPPRLDSKEWELYKQLPPGLIIYDTLRAAHSSDENDSQHMAIIIARLKELRELGFTILLLHHTPKGNENIYKGSTALLDLVDHVLGFENVNGKEGEPIEFDADNIYKLAVRIKTRYEPAQVFLKFNPGIKTFAITTDPEVETLEAIYALLKDKGELNTNQAYELIKRELDIKGKSQAIRLLKKGQDWYWKIDKRGRAVFYSPIVQPIYSQTDRPIEDKPENGQKPINKGDSPQTRTNSVKSHSPEDTQTKRPTDKMPFQGNLWEGGVNNAGNDSKGTGEDMVI